ncbi:MAG: hypothetical protein V4549_19765 [Bacteroidota bacterium]
MRIVTCILALSFTFIFTSFNRSSFMETNNTLTLDSTAFDFWLGKWKATWDENGKTCHGTNTITKMMNDKFIHESFDILDGSNKGFKGESFSVLDKADGKWKQTWIDTQGSYLDFTGTTDGDTKIFERTFTDIKGKTTHQRMRFYEIKKNSFMWDWENSAEGKIWDLAWRISYIRMN